MDRKEKIIHTVLSIHPEDVKKGKSNSYPPRIQRPDQWSERQLQGAIASYAQNCAPEDAAVLMDFTLAGFGKKGFLFSVNGLYASESGFKKIPMPILYDELESVEEDEQLSHLVLRYRDGRSAQVFTHNYTCFLSLALRMILRELRKAPDAEQPAAQTNNGARPAPKAVLENHTPTQTPETQAPLTEILNAAAIGGSALAQLKCGDMYYEGKGVEKNPAKALKWYLKAAKQGNAQAQYFCGYAYRKGDGTQVDPSQALYWLKQAAEQGHARAQGHYALMLRNGEGVPADEKTALAWMEKAAEQGVSFAQFRCGEMYERGEGAVISHAQAEAWYEKAAAQGEKRAQLALERLRQSRQQALKRLRRSGQTPAAREAEQKTPPEPAPSEPAPAEMAFTEAKSAEAASDKTPQEDAPEAETPPTFMRQRSPTRVLLCCQETETLLRSEADQPPALLEEFIQELDCTVVGQTVEPKQATEQYWEKWPSLVLVDADRKDGIKALQALQNESNGMTSLLAFGGPEGEIQAVQAGATGYLHRPLKEKALLRALSDLDVETAAKALAKIRWQAWKNGPDMRCILLCCSRAPWVYRVGCRKNLVDLLTQLGCEVVGQTDSRTQAVELFRRNWPGLVLLDSGWEDAIPTLREIRGMTEEKQARAVVFGRGAASAVVEAIQAGASDFLMTPVLETRLLQSLSSLGIQEAEKARALIPSEEAAWRAKRQKARKKGQGSILICSYSRYYLRLAQEVIEENTGYSVEIEECDGNRAVELYVQRQPDLMLMNLNMPNLDGLSALKQIRHFDPSAAVIMVTGLDKEDDAARAAGAVDCVSRPVSETRWVNAVKKALG